MEYEENYDELTTDDLQNNLFLALLDAGYTGTQAEMLAEKRYSGAYSTQEAEASIYPIRKLIALHRLPEQFHGLSDKQKDKFLWELGFDTKLYKYQVRLDWMRDSEDSPKQQYGEFIVCTERVDKGWTVGNPHASIEARYFYDQEEMRDIISCRGKAVRKKV
jgi:hypothetical protein